MIYVPNFQSNNCVVVVNSDTIRVYDNRPQYNSDINYTDYYIKSNYISNNGTAHFSNYSNLPVCHDISDITTNIWYRNDMPSILIMFTIIVIFGFILPLKIFLRLFRRFN